MNYEKIYNDLIQKRRINKIDRSKDNINIEYHHIIPVSCGGMNDKRNQKFNNEKFNIIGLTLNEHFFAHLLLLQIYKHKYGIISKQYKNMLKAIDMMLDYEKYGVRTSKLYKKIKLEALKNGTHCTTTGRMWVTNGKEDIFLKQNESIPKGFRRGRTINFTEEQKKEYSRKITIGTLGRKCWNSGKHGIYSNEYRKKISDNHADVSGKNNPRYGSRAMHNPKTNDRLIVKKEDIQKYLDLGYVFKDGTTNYNS